MKSAFADLPVLDENAERAYRAISWGGMEVMMADIHETRGNDTDEDCQCPHWGYVLKGQIRFSVAGQEEVYDGGDLFYLPPGHSRLSEVAGTQYILLMPSDVWQKEMARRSG